MIDFFDFLTGYADEESYRQGSIGDGFLGDFPTEIQKGVIYILEIKDFFGTNYETEESTLCGWRRSLKKLYPNNWKREMVDLGILLKGEDVEQFQYAIEKIAFEISKAKGILVVVGGSQSISFNLFKSIEKKFKSVCSVDKSLDLASPEGDLSRENWVSNMVIKPEYKLLNYYNFGSQVPFNIIENQEILEQLNFFNIGLGKLTEDLKKTEPYLRESHLLSVDMSSLASSLFNSSNNTVNGLNSREICGLARYAGLSPELNMIHISNFSNKLSKIEGDLIAEIIWYFIDAKNNMKRDGDIHTFRVQMDEGELVFLKSNESERWWIEVLVDGTIQRLPCEEEDYKQCLKGEVPERWSRFFKRFF